MIELEAMTLSDEIRIAEERTRKQLQPMQDIVNQHAGEWFGGRVSESTVRENHWHEWIATNLPLYYMNAPKVKGGSEARGASRIRAEAVARAIAEGVNASIERTDFDTEAFYCANDFAFCHAVMIVTLEDHVVNVPQPPDEIHPEPWFSPVNTLRPRADRVLPSRFIYDPLAVMVKRARWMGHIAEYDPEALREKAKSGQADGWVKGAIEDAVRVAQDDLPEREDMDEMPQRDEIVAYDIWIRHARPDPNLGPEQGYNGAICTVMRDDGGDAGGTYLRKPTPYKGPPCGPYVCEGAYGVTDSPWFLSPLCAVAPQVDELNTQAEVIAHGMQSYKRGVAVDSAQEDLVEAWTENDDSVVLPIAGLAENKNAIAMIETGGVTQEMFQSHMFLLDRLRRASGHSQNRSGEATGGTASEASIVQANISVRTEFLAKRFAKFVRQVVWIMGWQYFHNELILYMPTGSEESPFIDETTGMPMENPILVGGMQGEDGFSFEDIKLTIEPYSMERVDQAMLQQNWLRMMELVMSAAPMMPQTPWVDWKRSFEKGGDALNDPEFGDVIKYDILQQMLMMPMTANQGAPLTQTQPGGAQPMPGQLQGAMTAQANVPQSARQNGKAPA